MKHKKIAIIGAGMAGATLANQLINGGYQVTIFEKSRGTGGRQSSCRIGTDSADLGAPWYAPKTKQFRQWLMERPEVALWQAKHRNFCDTEVDRKCVFLSTPRQSSLTQNLIKGAMLCTEANILRIQSDDHGVRLDKELGEIKSLFDAVIVTTPAAQAIRLLSVCPQFSNLASTTKSSPSWVSVISIKGKNNIEPDILSGNHPILHRAIRDSKKPGRNSWSRKEIWVLEANSEWSQRHRDSAPNNIGKALIKAFAAVVDQPIEISCIRTHRWLYARHQSATSADYLWDPISKIGVCADWLNNPGNEGAWLSANALANHLLCHSTNRDCLPLNHAVVS